MMDSHSNTVAPRRPRSVTRAALLDKARELIRSGEPLTTVSLTRAVGVTQPAFYAHFRSVEECEREVFREVAERLRAMHTNQRRTLLSGRALDVEAITEHLESIIADLIDNAVWFEIAQRRRHDISAMGDVVREVEARAREEFATEFLETMKALGVPGNWEAVAILQAELLQASVNAAIGALLAGRQRDVQFVAQTLALVFVGSLRALAEGDPR
jgi:AcrR family transcriptional regulator